MGTDCTIYAKLRKENVERIIYLDLDRFYVFQDLDFFSESKGDHYGINEDRFENEDKFKNLDSFIRWCEKRVSLLKSNVLELPYVSNNYEERKLYHIDWVETAKKFAEYIQENLLDEFEEIWVEPEDKTHDELFYNSDYKIVQRVKPKI